MKNWYILQTYTGYERKIQNLLNTHLNKKDIDPNVLVQVVLPVEEIIETQQNGKKKVRKDLFMPGYLMLEMDLPEVGWKATCSFIRAIQGVNGFVGTTPNERPRPITNDEAKVILLKTGAIKGDKKVTVTKTFNVGDKVKITSGPFASFNGEVELVNPERNKMTVKVQIFGRVTPVELTLQQVEKI